MATPESLMGTMAGTDPNLPNFVRPEVRAAHPDLCLMDDLLTGTRRMWEHSSSGTGNVPYIPKWDRENPKTYDIRRKCETVFEGVGRTLSASIGMLFATPPRVTWNLSEAAMTEQWANLDAAGTAAPVLLKRFAESSIRDGLGAILVDHPLAPVDADGTPVRVDASTETPLGLRPTWALYSRQQIINWRTAVVNNRRALTMIVFAECGDVDTGAFGMATVQRFRVLRLLPSPSGYQATWTLYELRAGANGGKAEDFTVHSQGVVMNRTGQIADFLPVSIAYTGRTDAPLCATIPLLGVAWANLAHWQQSTDLRFYRMVAAYPQPKLKGELSPDPITGKAQSLGLGPLVAVHVASDGDFEWMELAGTSMAQLENGIREKLAQMGQLGMSFLTTDTRAAETADAKRLDASAQNATLATAAQGVEDAANGALEHHAWFLGIDKPGAAVLTISRDFETTALDAQLLQAYVALVAEGFPKRPILEAMQAGGRIPADADLDALEVEWEAGVQAALDVKQQAAKDKLAAAQANAGGDPNPQPNPMDGNRPIAQPA